MNIQRVTVCSSSFVTASRSCRYEVGVSSSSSALLCVKISGCGGSRFLQRNYECRLSTWWWRWRQWHASSMFRDVQWRLQRFRLASIARTWVGWNPCALALSRISSFTCQEICLLKYRHGTYLWVRCLCFVCVIDYYIFVWFFLKPVQLNAIGFEHS